MSEFLQELKRNDTARAAVKQIRAAFASVRKAATGAVRKPLWGLQRLLQKNSSNFGTPSHVSPNIFGYKMHPSTGEMDIELEVIYPEVFRSFGLPKTFDDSVHPHFKNAAMMKVEKEYVFSMPGGRVFGPGSTIITPDDSLLLDESYEFGARNPLDYAAYKRVSLPKCYELEQSLAAVSSWGDENYFHWVCDSFPRIDILRRSRFANRIDKYYVWNPGHRFIREMLELAGIHKDQIIAGTEHPHVRPTKLYVPSRCTLNGLLTDHAIEFVRNTVLPHVPARTGKKRRLYCSRSDARFRRVENEEEVFRALEQRGFEQASMSGLSVVEQAQLFRDAEVVIGAHGANLTNLLYCEPGTKVLELFSPNYKNFAYYLMSEQLKLSYAYLSGMGHKEETPKFASKYTEEHIRIAMDRLNRALDTMGI